MAELVGGFLVPHDPMVLTDPQAPPEAVQERITEAYAEVARRVADLAATTLIIIGTDHYLLFGPGCLPQALIGSGDVDGPLERLPGMRRRQFPDNTALARHLVSHGHRTGIDWAVADSLTVDHSVAIPYFRIGLDAELPVIPIYLACGVEPMLPLRRAEQIGQNLKEAVESWDGNERVVVIGSGGISHWVGTGDMGRVNEQFDRMVLDLVTAGDVAALVSLTDDYILEHGGNGGLEIRNFIAAMAALGSCTGDVIAYEAVPEWITGLGFAELIPSRAAEGLSS
ncbi:DODA-type extradiol aromatic ring-opening family dioxygenase [Nocardia stercoris]|uniref:Protocatechuate 3,4-dioxygenase n=1 Tax=Nocardia stercoris TaxID=2483361 RepID=A0A3M2L4T3_9NOCA|nr:protocatechuate 3,4-dioxygenase [Nocardia stercoris]RMI32657.1 protocatechuate 3,4-dioxygenase [Nocardia stercoris]